MADEVQGQVAESQGQPLEPLEVADKEAVVEKEGTVAEKEVAALELEKTPEFQSKLAKSTQTYQKRTEELTKEVNRLKNELGEKQEAALQKSLADLPDKLIERGEIDEQEALTFRKAIAETNAARQGARKDMAIINAWMPQTKRAIELTAAKSAIESELGKDGVKSVSYGEVEEIADVFKECMPGNEREYELAKRIASAIVKQKFGDRKQKGAEGKETPVEKSGADRPDSTHSTIVGGRASLENLSPADRIRKRDELIRQGKK